MKKIVALVLAMLMVIGMVSLASAETESKGIIYIITPSTSNPFFATEQIVGAPKVEELGYTAKCFSHDDDAAKQLELFEAAINDKAVAIICDNAGADASIEAVRKANEAGIPVVLIDREINETGLALAQIVADNAQGAAAIAEKWVEAMNYEGKYAELLGLESDTNCQVRSENYHSVIDQYDGLEMVAQQSANWSQTEGYSKTEAILQAHPEITGIICGNDTMACGAAQACIDAGRTDIKIIGLDGSDDAGTYIKNGQMVGTALQQIAKITEMAIEQAVNYIENGVKPESEKQLVECVAITIDNVEYLNAFVYTGE
jgi:erythritol transport system substrate-binding protein